jgi:hypothetical protein
LTARHDGLLAKLILHAGVMRFADETPPLLGGPRFPVALILASAISRRVAKGERWFCSEAEAIAAGWQRPAAIIWTM